MNLARKGIAQLAKIYRRAMRRGKPGLAAHAFETAQHRQIHNDCAANHVHPRHLRGGGK